MLCLGFVGVYVLAVLFSLPTSDVFLGYSSSMSIAVIDDEIKNRTLKNVMVNTGIRPEKDLCTLSLIRKHSLDTGHFLEKGNWTMTHNNTDGSYSPDMCVIPQILDAPGMKTCFQEKRVRRILILGDSNGLRMYKGLLEHLLKAGVVCSQVKKEITHGGKIPDINYFASGTGLDSRRMKTEPKTCVYCDSVYVRCRSVDSNAINLDVEYISMISMKDRDITTAPINITNPCSNPYKVCGYSETTQKFIFGEYLKSSAVYHDWIWLFSSSHDKYNNGRQPINSIEEHARYLSGILRYHVPPTSKLVWLTSPAEYPKLKPEKWQNITFEGKYSTEQQIRRQNEALFKVMKSVIENQYGSIYPFFDIQRMEEDLLPYWCVDGIHLLPVWYELVTSYLLTIMCNSHT